MRALKHYPSILACDVARTSRRSGLLGGISLVAVPDAYSRYHSHKCTCMELCTREQIAI